VILRIGHTELRVTDLDAAHAFYVNALGFVEVARDEHTIYLRGMEEFDLWTLALVGADQPGLGHFALRVDDEGDLDRLEALHERLGLPVTRVAAGAEPGQGEALRVVGPEGFPIEFYHRMEQLPLPQDGMVLPMRDARLRHGTGPLRIDHINLRTSSMSATLGYLMDDLEFGISEYIERDGEMFATWLRRHTGSHDIAVLAAQQSALHHLAYLVPEPASLIRLADALSDLGFDDAVEFGPARHGVTNALFLYVRDPSGNRLELYTGDYVRDRDLPPIKWTWDDFLGKGRTWWGAAAPESFAETTPLAAGWATETEVPA
jgi:catechol 2,3-dioxygenase